MKSMNVFRLLMASLLAIGVQSAVFASDIAGVAGNGLEQRGELAKAVVATEDIIAGAQMAINEARGSLFSCYGGSCSTGKEDKKNVSTIIAQNAIIVQAEQKLKKMTDTFIKKAEAELIEEGFFSKLVTGIKNFAAKIIAPFRVGYGKTEEGKENAPEIIKGLEEQQARITQIYGTLLKTNLTGSEQAQLKSRYEAAIAQLNDAIYEQQLITGDVMSTQRKVLLGAAAAGTAAGLALAKQYFSTSEEINQQPIVTPTVEPIAVEPTTVESTIEPIVAPAVESTIEPAVVEPIKPTVEPTIESTVELIPTTEISQQPVTPEEEVVAQGTLEVPVVTQQEQGPEERIAAATGEIIPTMEISQQLITPEVGEMAAVPEVPEMPVVAQQEREPEEKIAGELGDERLAQLAQEEAAKNEQNEWNEKMAMQQDLFEQNELEAQKAAAEKAAQEAKEEAAKNEQNEWNEKMAMQQDLFEQNELEAQKAAAEKAAQEAKEKADRLENERLAKEKEEADRLEVEQSVKSVEQTESTVELTEPTIEPTESTVKQTEPTVKQTEPTVKQTEPIVEQTEPIVEQTEPIVEQTEPIVEQTEPIVEQTEPIVEQTEPTVEQTEPTVKLTVAKR